MMIGEIAALDQIGFPILSALILVPIAWCLFVFLYRGPRLRELAIAGSLVELLLAVIVLVKFDPGTRDFQFTEMFFHISGINIDYHLGIDGISVLFVLLTAVVNLMLILAAWNHDRNSQRKYFISLLMIQATTMGVLTSLDLVVFFLFWELTLVPLFLMTKLWGASQKSQNSSQKYMTYMLTSSAPLLIGFLLLGLEGATAAGIPEGRTFNLVSLINTGISPDLQVVVLIFLVLGFAAKIPLIPFHTWLPSFLVSGPFGLAAFLVGVKLGVYGLLRFVLPLLPDALAEWGWVLAVLGILALVYGALIALVQTNLRRLIAFSGISHVGLMLIGIASLNYNGIQGAILASFHLGIVATALFLMAEFVHVRYGSTDINALGGLATKNPRLSGLFFLFGLAYIAVPGTSGFTAEFITLLGAYQAHWSYAVFGLTGVILSAGCFLWYFQRAFCGEVRVRHTKFYDLTLREFLILLLPLLFIFWLGLFPKPMLNVVEGSVGFFVERVELKKLELQQGAGMTEKAVDTIVQ